jgi:nucleotide-binding universal stress UspA family protein
MVAVDGSEASHQAFELVRDNLFRPTQDKLTVAHSFNPIKTYLPFNMQAEVIKETYQSLIIGYGTHSSLVWEPQDMKKLTTKEHVVDMAKHYGADILVVGMHGRKGPKE